MREKFYRFMQGRYGVDQLYRFIFFLALVLMIIKKSQCKICGKSEISAADCKNPLLAGSTEKTLAGEKVSSYLHLSKM